MCAKACRGRRADFFVRKIARGKHTVDVEQLSRPARGTGSSRNENRSRRGLLSFIRGLWTSTEEPEKPRRDEELFAPPHEADVLIYYSTVRGELEKIQHIQLYRKKHIQLYNT